MVVLAFLTPHRSEEAQGELHYSRDVTSPAEVDPVSAFLPDGLSGGRPSEINRVVTPLLDQISAQAANADHTRSVSPELIHALKQSDLM